MTVPHLTVLATRALVSGGAGPVAKSGEAAKSGPIGFAVILVLCVVCYFLFKSMSRHLRKVREEFPADEPPAAAPGAPPTGAPPAVTGPAPQLPKPEAASPPERTPEA